MSKLSYLFLALPFSLLLIPLPFAPPHLEFLTRAALTAAILFFLALSAMIVRLTEKLLPSGRLSLLLNASLPGLVLLLAIALSTTNADTQGSRIVALIAMTAAIVTAQLFRRHERLLSAAGPLSLIVVLNLLLATELTLRSVPRVVLAPKMQRIGQPVKSLDRALDRYDRNGFRGRIVRKNDSHQGLRIFSTGGSSTYGLPMRHVSSTYPSVLERILAERRPFEGHEVYNAGVPGFGITQIVDVLERRLVSLEPDVVTVCAWFNDAALGSGWYGFPGRSETEALKMLRIVDRIKGLPGLSTVLSSHSFAWYQFYLTRLIGWFAGEGGQSTAPTRPRMTPEEFSAALRHVISLGEQHHFLPVFIFEPEHRTRPRDEAIERNRYFQAMLQVAKEGDIPLVDTLRPFGERRHEWLFYDVIHSNEEAHRTIAEAIYQTLFLGEGNTEKGRRFLAAKGISPELSTGATEIVTQWRREDLEKAGELIFSIRGSRLAEPDTNQVRVGIFSGLERIGTLEGITSRPKNYSVSVAGLRDARPLLDISLRGEFSEGVLNEKFTLARGGLRAPVYIHAVGQNNTSFPRSLIRINGETFASTAPGYEIVLLTPRTGRVIAVRYLRFSQRESWAGDIEELNEFITGSFEEGRAPIMVFAIGASGAIPEKGPRLLSLIRRCGGSGRFPASDESMVLIGACESNPSLASETIGRGQTEKEIGSREFVSKQLIEVETKGSIQPYRRYFR